MYFYFFCGFPAVIKFQGVVFGTVDNSVKFCNFDKPYPLVEICPLMDGNAPVAFFLSDDFLNAPPENVTVTDLKGGYFLKFSKPAKTDGFKILAQEKYGDANITAFIDNGCKISLETKTDFFAETLDFSPLSVTFRRGEGINANLIFALFDCGDKKILKVYGVKETALLFAKETDEFNLSALGFTTNERIRDIAKHRVVCEYSLSGGEIKELSHKVTTGDNFDREKLNERLIPYAFSEEFLCGGDYSFYLADNVKENADKLGGFFGDFIGVTPPPLFRNYKEIGLVYKTAERKYSVEYFTFDIADNKITNINKI